MSLSSGFFKSHRLRMWGSHNSFPFFFLRDVILAGFNHPFRTHDGETSPCLRTSDLDQLPTYVLVDPPTGSCIVGPDLLFSFYIRDAPACWLVRYNNLQILSIVHGTGGLVRSSTMRINPPICHPGLARPRNYRAPQLGTRYNN